MERLCTELVWDSEATGTAGSRKAPALSIGGKDGWTAEELLSAAIEADIMARFIQLASEWRLQVLGYVSGVNLSRSEGDDAAFEIVVRPCIVLAGSGEESTARYLLSRALRDSPVCGSLKAIQLEANIVVAHESDVEGEPSGSGCLVDNA